jgi:hypothetical protein
LAFQFDLSAESCIAQVVAPTNVAGAQWKDVAGGATVVAPNGDAFIVGGTRTDTSLGPTNYVVKLSTAVEDGEAGTTSTYASFLTFDTPRLGAAAVWSPYLAGGLVVVGGSTTGTGVEYLGGAATEAGASLPTSVQYPSDPTQGAGAVALGGTEVLVAGGTLNGRPAPVRMFDLMCSSSCLAEAGASGSGGSDAGSEDASHREDGSFDASIADSGGAGSGLDGSAIGLGLVPLLTAQGFSRAAIGAWPVPSTEPAAVFIGSEKDGFTHAYVVSSATLSGTELPMRVERKGSLATTAIQTPIPQAVVIGGDLTMESYIP